MNGRVDVDLALLAKNWWLVALRGIAAILFGVLAAIVPGLTLALLVMLFGAYALIEGGFNVVAAVRGATGGRAWWALLLEGLVSLAAGVVAFIMPGLTALALVYLIAAWAVFTGILEIAAAVRLRKHITGEWWLALTGVLSIAFGVLVAFFPGAGALAMVLWIGAYSIVFGILLLAVAFKLRRVRDDVEGRRTVAHAT
jgi:uncharacterized membrane protein HdeD (DUF308 family)